MRDLFHNISVTQALIPAVATTDKTSSAIDMQGFNSLAVIFNIGDSGDTLSGSVFWTLKLQESDDNSQYTDVAASDLHNASATVVIDAPTEDSTAVTFGYKGNKRYVKALAVKTGTHSNGTPIGIIAVRGNASLNPAM